MADRMAEDRYPERFEENRRDWDRRLRAHAEGEGSEAERAALDAWLRRDPAAMARYRELGGASRNYNDTYFDHEHGGANGWSNGAAPRGPEAGAPDSFSDDPFAEASRPAAARRYRNGDPEPDARWSGGSGESPDWREPSWEGAETAARSADRGSWRDGSVTSPPEQTQGGRRDEADRYDDYWAKVGAAGDGPTSGGGGSPDNHWREGAYPDQAPRPASSDPLSALKAARTAYGPSEQGFSLPPLERPRETNAPTQGASYSDDRAAWERPPEQPNPPRPEPRRPPSPQPQPAPPYSPNPGSHSASPPLSSAPPPLPPREEPSPINRSAAYGGGDFRADAEPTAPARTSARSPQSRRPMLGSVAAARAPANAPPNSQRAPSSRREFDAQPKPAPSARPGPSARADRRAPQPTPEPKEVRTPRTDQRPPADQRPPRQPQRPATRPEPADAPLKDKAPSGARRAAPQSQPTAAPHKTPPPRAKSKSPQSAPKTAAKAKTARAKEPTPKQSPSAAQATVGSSAENVTAALRKTGKPQRAPARLGFATAMAAFAALAFGFYLGAALNGGGGSGGVLEWRDRVAVGVNLKTPEHFALRQIPPTASRAAIQKLGALLELDLSIAGDPPVGLSLQDVSHLRHGDLDLASVEYLDARGSVVSLTVARRQDTPAAGEKLAYDTLALSGHTGIEWRSSTHVFLLAGAATDDELRAFAYLFGKELN